MKHMFDSSRAAVSARLSSASSVRCSRDHAGSRFHMAAWANVINVAEINCEGVCRCPLMSGQKGCYQRGP